VERSDILAEGGINRSPLIVLNRGDREAQFSHLYESFSVIVERSEILAVGGIPKNRKSLILVEKNSLIKINNSLIINVYFCINTYT